MRTLIASIGFAVAVVFNIMAAESPDLIRRGLFW